MSGSINTLLQEQTFKVVSLSPDIESTSSLSQQAFEGF